jgi:hypothetical protein
MRTAQRETETMKSHVVGTYTALLIAMLAIAPNVAMTQASLTHTGTTAAPSQIDKELTETQQQKGNAEAAAAAARQGASDARKRATELRAQKTNARTAEDKKR